MARFLSSAAALLALLLAGCGGSGSAGEAAGSEQTLLLPAPVSGATAPVFLALSRGYDEAEGVALELRDEGDALDLLRTGRVDAAVVGIEQVRAPMVVVMALVQGEEAGRPRRRGEPERPGVVVVVTRDTLADHRPEVRAIVRTIQRGMTEAATDPESAVTAMLDADDALDRGRLTAQLERAAPGFTAGAAAPGAVDVTRLKAWSRWARREVRTDATLVRRLSRD
jgi:ABC-type nitrate/sulfonate/bicarbonate transport system substrate-binding protein